MGKASGCRTTGAVVHPQLPGTVTALLQPVLQSTAPDLTFGDHALHLQDPDDLSDAAGWHFPAQGNGLIHQIVVDTASLAMVVAPLGPQPDEAICLIGLQISAYASLRDLVAVADLADDLAALSRIQPRCQERSEHFSPFSGYLVSFAVVLHGQILTLVGFAPDSTKPRVRSPSPFGW